MLIAGLVLGWLVIVGLGCAWMHGAEIRRHDTEEWEADLLQEEIRRHKEEKLLQYLSEDQ